MGGPVSAAQGPEPGTADRPRTGTSSRPARRSTRFSDLLGGLVEDNGLTEQKRKLGNAAADGSGVAYPFFPPVQGNEPVRSTGFTRRLESMTNAGSEDAIAGSPVPLDRVGAADFALLPFTLTNPAGLTPTASGTGSASAEAQSSGVPSAPAPEGFTSLTNKALRLEAPEQLPATASAAIAEDGFSPKTDGTQPAPDGQPPGLQTLLPAGGKDSASTAKADISVPGGCLQGTATGELHFPASPRRGADSREEQTDRTVSGARPGPASTAATDRPPLPSLSDPVRPGSYFAVPVAADALLGAAAPAGASAQRPDGDAPAGLAFTARVVPLPAAEASATDADEKLPEAKTEKPDTGRTPVPQVSRFSNDHQKEDSSRGVPAADRAPGTEARVSSSLPAGSVQPPAPPTGESGITEPEAAPTRRTGATDGKPDPGPAAASAREIQLQFHQGEQRVDVRLAERSGEVRVEVRTPDAQLAGALRAGLPALATRLEQTGFHAETWHPAIFHQSVRPAGHLATSSSDSSDSQNGSQQGSRQQPEPRQQKPNPAHGAKSQRKEFRWLMSQLP
jgi:hypothetical protein